MDEPLKAIANLPPQTSSSATSTGEKRKREGLVSEERENSSETEDVIIVGDTKAVKDFGFGGGGELHRSKFSKLQAFNGQSNLNLKGSLERNASGEEPERAKQDSTFNDFDKLREESKFAVGQTWALYDDKVDGMPRLYAQITKVSVPCFCLSVTWLEPDPDPKEKIQGYEEGLPVSVGRFKLGKTEDIKDRGRFSHLVQCSEGSSLGTFSVYPKEGETWAIFKAHITSLSSYQNHDWSAHPDSHCKYTYAFVEILSEDGDYPRVPVGFLHKAKGFSGVFCRFNKEVDTSYIKRGFIEQFSHRVPSFKTTGIEAEGVPRRGAYELDPAALPGNIKEIDVPLHLLEEPTVSNSEEGDDNKHSQCVYFASKGITFQTGQVWSFCSGDDNLPRHYGKIQKITFLQAFEQDPVVKLHIGRLKARLNKDVIQWSDKDMPVGCGNFRARKVLEIFTNLDVLSRLISLESTGDGDDYNILPKTGDVWAVYRNWSKNNKVVDLKSQTYDLVEVLDDKLDYKVQLLAPVGGFKSANSAGFGSVYVAATEHWIEGAEVRFTIPKCEMLRFSHQVTTSRVTKEVHGTWQEVYEPAIEALPGLSCVVSVGEKRKRNEHGKDFDGLKFNDFKKLRGECNFAVGQTWALYDDKVDEMPRLYARIRKVSAPSFELRITYLEPDPDDEKQIQWLEEDLPVSAGQFKLGKHHNTKDRSIFSHVLHCMEGTNTGHLTVSPRKGETWALFKNWDINWCSDPASHRSYEYEFVEILSDYADKAGVSVAYLHKAKGYASVFFRMGSDIFRILPHRLYRFSHSVPSFKLTGIDGVPKDAYELDQDALPETIEEIMMPSNSETQRKPKAIYFASEGKVFQTGQFWSFYSGDDDSPRYYCKIQKVSFVQVLNQEPSFKLHISRLKKAIPFPEDVIDWEEGKMPRGCGTYYPRTVLETITPHELSQQVMPQTSMDGKEYIILPKIGEVWITYRSWSPNIEVDDDLDGLGYDIVEVLDDTLDYKVVLLERQSGNKEDQEFEYKWFRAVTKSEYNDLLGVVPVFTIPKSERLRFSHKVHASRITREIHGELKDLFKVDSRPLPYFLSGDLNR
ncbi:DNAJ heat shock amino-terminal domain protein [Hirschfeldia incana]|nr:DNAJ heat shock amino-terminal domain protein [Hirschfeldia incana]